MSPRASARAAIAAELPDGAAFAAAADGPFRRALRCHPRRGALSAWGALAPVPWSPLGAFHDSQIDPGGQLDWHTGAAYAQDAGSQLPALLLEPQPGEVVIDCCAAPGSKATQIGLALHDEGLLVCCDRSRSRRRALVENLARQGIACGLVTPVAPEELARRHPGAADAVLLDAPCSGHDDRSLRQTEAMAERQLALLERIVALLRPGGRLVYSTCTAARAEDEGVIVRFLARHASWRVEARRPPGCDGDLDGFGAVRLWPHHQGTEPFFACLLRAPGSGVAAGFPGRPPPGDDSLARYLGTSTLACWRSGSALLAASRAAAACALPSEARGCLIARENRMSAWGAQALIERGAPHATIPRDRAIEAIAGGSLALEPGTLVAHALGGPIGVVGADGRLDVPSVARRAGVR